MRTHHKYTNRKKITQRNKKAKTIKQRQKGGSIIDYRELNENPNERGFNGMVITPNIPYIDKTLITKLGKDDEINNEINAYKIIKQLNNNQDEYNKMVVKVLCDPQPILFQLNRELLNIVNINTLVIKDEYTHGIIMKKGDNTLVNYINNLFVILEQLKDIIRSLVVLNENGYIHGDIKPNNILVFEHKLYLIDFGTFISKSEFIEKALNNDNKLSIYLEHIPFECQYINGQINEINNYFFNKSLNMYLGQLQHYINLKKNAINNNDLINKIKSNIENTFNYYTINKQKNNKQEFLSKLFDTFDTFCVGLTIIQLLNKFNVNESFLIIYDFILEYCYTYDITKRITMKEYLTIFETYVRE